MTIFGNTHRYDKQLVEVFEETIAKLNVVSIKILIKHQIKINY